LDENSSVLNERVKGLACLRCRAFYDLDHKTIDRGVGCPACLQVGYPASLVVVYNGVEDFSPVSGQPGMAAYNQLLPYMGYPSLGEGGTPLFNLPGIAASLGIEQLWIKNEGSNPTGSHKDRMSPLVVARAVDLGRETVVAASSGNAGASLAAYAGRAGLQCVIISTPTITPFWAEAITLTGARLVLQETPKDRWVYMAQKVREDGWYPVTNYLDPPVGSNPFGVQGYKTVAYEIMEACQDQPPTVLVVPTARGDLLWGIWGGLTDLVEANQISKLPRLVAVEPIPRLSRVLAGGDYRISSEGEPHDMVSIGGTTSTYQSRAALLESKGAAVEVSNPSARKAHRELAKAGLYAELSAAASLAGLWSALERRLIQPNDSVVLLITSHGYKEQIEI
jgi:threonine synthase